MSRYTGSRQFRERIIGRTISGVIARPGRDGEPPLVLMLRFDDGGVVEFVSPRSDQLLEEALRASGQGVPDWSKGARQEAGAQLSLEGLFGPSGAGSSSLGLSSGCA